MIEEAHEYFNINLIKPMATDLMLQLRNDISLSEICNRITLIMKNVMNIEPLPGVSVVLDNIERNLSDILFPSDVSDFYLKIHESAEVLVLVHRADKEYGGDSIVVAFDSCRTPQSKTLYAITALCLAEYNQSFIEDEFEILGLGTRIYDMNLIRNLLNVGNEAKVFDARAAEIWF